MSARPGRSAHLNLVLDVKLGQDHLVQLEQQHQVARVLLSVDHLAVAADELLVDSLERCSSAVQKARRTHLLDVSPAMSRTGRRLDGGRLACTPSGSPSRQRFDVSYAATAAYLLYTSTAAPSSNVGSLESSSRAVREGGNESKSSSLDEKNPVRVRADVSSNVVEELTGRAINLGLVHGGDGVRKECETCIVSERWKSYELPLTRTSSSGEVRNWPRAFTTASSGVSPLSMPARVSRLKFTQLTLDQVRRRVEVR